MANTRITAPLKKWLTRHVVIAGFVLAYAFTLSITVPAALDAHGFLKVRVPKGLLTFANNFAPGIAGILLVAVIDGKAGLRNLGRRVCRWRVSVSNYLLVFGITALGVWGSLILYQWIGGTPPKLGEWSLLPILFLVMLLFAPLWEEVCWRGLILPELQTCRTPFIASLLLGTGWGCWHIPYYLGAGAQGEKTVLFLLTFLVGALPLTILFTWIYNRTGGSLFLVVLFHSALDAALAFFYGPLPVGELRPFIFFVGVLTVMAVIVLGKVGIQLGRSTEV